MSSPWRRGDNTSPASQVRRDDTRNRRPAQHSPYRPRSDTLTSTVWEEFSRMYVNEERVFRGNVDEQFAEQERLHMEALSQAAAEHERVREGAERARERVELEIERERRRREEEEIRALETERKAKTDREAAERQRVKEDLERQEEEQKRRSAEEREIESARIRLAEQRQKDEAEAAQRRREDEQKQQQQQKEAADRKAKEASVSAGTKVGAAAAPAATPLPAAPNLAAAEQGAAPFATTTAPTGVGHAHPAPGPQSAPPQSVTQSIPATNGAAASAMATREAMHQRYLELHKQLKAMRKHVVTEGKKNPALKTKLGDWRRKIVTLMGQLTTDKVKNRKPLADLILTLQDAQKFPEPSIDVSSYMISVRTDGSPIPVSGPLVYLLNILSKGIISQLVKEVSSTSSLAEPIGIVAVTVFAQPGFKARGTYSLIDILLAKYHKSCPLLWGIYGDEKTAQGRSRIGWLREDGAWVEEQRHSERMAGLGAGYASIALRDFNKSKNDNPYPPSNYWATLSYIVNTPPAQVQPTHFYVLKALIDGYIPKFIGLYGQAGLVALRKAMIEFPAQAARSPAREAMTIMAQTAQRDLRLTL